VTTQVPDVLADPVGVIVDLVAGAELALDRGVITAVVTQVAGGRARQRRLARCLAGRPSVLADGRSPASEAAGELLIALRRAGAVSIALPVCATCGKQLRSMRRRGQDWYCAACGRRPARCASCGQDRATATVDRQGRPRCRQCPDDDARDPVAILTGVITDLEPSLPAGRIAAAARRAQPGPAKLRRLAWAVEDAPGLLTGDGAHAPLPAVLRLIDELCDAGAQVITRPACPRCHRVIRLAQRIGGQWLCRNCVARSRAQPCSRCGALREAAARDEHGRPRCSNCLVNDPANQETCVTCGRRRRVSARTGDGPLCDTCRPRQLSTCHICGEHAPCQVSKATGKPRCLACTKRWARCAGCGQTRPVRGGSRDQPLCSACALPDPGLVRSCPGCGQPGRLHAGRCARCTIQRRLHDLLGDEHGQIPAGLQGIYQALAAAERPATVASWLDSSTAPAVLRDLTAGRRSLTHQALDELPPGKALEHLRSVLVATGTLPPRDEQLTRLERWITRAIAGRPDPGQQLLHRYAIWHVARRLRSRLGGAHATYSQVVAARRNIKAAAVLLDWLTARGLTLATARQADLDAWLSSEHATYRADAGNFIRWAQNHKLTRLDAPAARWNGPSGVIDTETRWEQARWLLHDSTLEPDDRVAGLLVLLYAQWPAAISRLTLGHVDTSDNQVRIRLGREPVILPEPLGALVLQLAATRRGHAAIGDPGTSPWLFPGGQPGQPISAYQLAERLRQLGIRSGQSRSAALFQLAADLPAAILARLPGIHITVAVAWQRAAAGDWAAYAADISHRLEH
jgi:uncharacterized protein YidB (DUF937 family)